MNRKFTSFFNYACLAFIAAGVIARFFFLNVSYEYDEIFTAITANPALPLKWIWVNWLVPDVHPPLHNIFLWFYNHTVPYGPEIWLRLPSLLFGFGAWYLAWKMFPRRFGKTALQIYMVLFAGSFYFILYSQHARAYALMLLLSTPLTFLFLRMSRLVGKKRPVPGRMWAWFGGLSLLLCWSHYFGALCFGVMSLLLFFQAVLRRQRVTWFIAVPCAVLLLFLPWLVPNFMYNLSQARFTGNWWANVTPWFAILPGLMNFFFNYSYSAAIMGILLVLGLFVKYERFKVCGQIAFGRELLLLFLLLAGVLGLAGLLSLKMYVMFGRYFTEIMPALYLFCTLAVAGLVRRHIWAKALFLLFALVNLGLFSYNWWIVFHSDYFSARVSARFYRDNAPQKELFVIAMEAFPPNSLEAMYSFYPNTLYGMNARVTELYHLDETARDRALERSSQAFIWMPNCNVVKLSRLAQEWRRSVGVKHHLSTSCFLDVSGKDGQLSPGGSEKGYESVFF